jgi:peptide deformylase
MSETALKIRIFGDPVLRRKSSLVKEVSAQHRHILSRMARIMYEQSGIGLAAPQVGINEQMIVVDIGSGLYKLINPRIVKKEGRQAIEEGCLSIPGVCIKIKRARKVTVRALDESGKQLTIDAEDLLACVFQHEIDHLRGKLIADYATVWDKIKIKNKLQALQERSKNERLPESETKSCQLQL